MKDFKTLCFNKEPTADIVKEFSNDIRLEFGIDKCYVIIIRGQIQLSDYDRVWLEQTMGTDKVYKYPDVKPARQLNHLIMKK